MQLKPEKYIATLLAKEIPYTVDILGVDIAIDSHEVYPPGNLARLFLKTLLEKVDIKDKVIADLGAGCGTYDIVLAKNGAKAVVGLDINPAAIACANKNLEANSLQDRVKIVQGDGADVLLDDYSKSFDFITSGAPWSTIDEKQFETIASQHKEFYRAFYDIDDRLINSILSTGFQLLKDPHSNIYMTASLNMMPRLEQILHNHQVLFDVLAAEDIHSDGNTHYILAVHRETSADIGNIVL